MGISIGNKNVSSIFIGNKKVSKIFDGNKLVYSGEIKTRKAIYNIEQDGAIPTYINNCQVVSGQKDQ